MKGFYDRLKTMLEQEPSVRMAVSVEGEHPGMQVLWSDPEIWTSGDRELAEQWVAQLRDAVSGSCVQLENDRIFMQRYSAQPELVILDVMLPGMNGFDVARKARKKGIRTPILMLTAKSDLDLLVDSKLRGLKFVGFMEDVRQAAGMPVDVFDISHIEQGSLIDREIRSTGVTIYEK